MKYEGTPQELLNKLMEPQPEVVVATGGPAGGKSTVVEAARAQAAAEGRLLYVVPEVPTMWMEQHGVNLGELAQTDRDAYLRAQIEISRTKGELKEEGLRELQGTNGILLTDRGRADDGAYMSWGEFIYVARQLNTTPSRLVHEHADKVVFLRSLAVNHPDAYTQKCGNNGTRYEDAAQASATDIRTLDQWRHHPELHVVDCPDIRQKTKEALGFILAGEVELEERWEVDPKTAAEFVWHASSQGNLLNTMHLAQTYHSIGGIDYRLRYGISGDGHELLHFAIKDPRERGNNELRRSLTPDEYACLRGGELEGALRKDRHVVLDGSQIWHCDQVWDPSKRQDRWFFEAEVPTLESFDSLAMPVDGMHKSDYNTRRFARDNVTMFA